MTFRPKSKTQFVNELFGCGTTYWQWRCYCCCRFSNASRWRCRTFGIVYRRNNATIRLIFFHYYKRSFTFIFVIRKTKNILSYCSIFLHDEIMWQTTISHNENAYRKKWRRKINYAVHMNSTGETFSQTRNEFFNVHLRDSHWTKSKLKTSLHK